MRISGTYLAGGLAQQAVGFLLLPLYLTVLSPAEYGALEILNTTGIIMVMALTLGLPSAIVKAYHRDCRSEYERQSILTTSLSLSVPMLLFGCGILIAASESIAHLLLQSGDAAELVRLMAVWVLLTGVSQTVFALFRTREEAAIVALLSLGVVVVGMGLNVAFVYVLRWGVRGVLAGNIISTAFTLLLTLPLLRRRIRTAFQPRLVRPLLIFGLLVVPSAAAGWIMGMSDRYILRYYGELASVGVYGLGYKIGMVLDVLVVTPFQAAWPAFAFAISQQENHRETFARTLTYLLAVEVLVLLALSNLTSPLLLLIGRADYLPAQRIVPMVALAYLFNGVHYCVSPGIHIAGKTKLLPVLIASAATLNVVLNLLWIPSFGMLGAAWSTTVAYGSLALATLVVSTVVHPVSYEYGRLAKICAAGAMAYLLGRAATSDSAPTAAALGLGAIASFPLSLLALGFLQPGERALLGQMFQRAWPRRVGGEAPPLRSIDCEGVDR